MSLSAPSIGGLEPKSPPAGAAAVAGVVVVEVAAVEEGCEVAEAAGAPKSEEAGFAAADG